MNNRKSLENDALITKMQAQILQNKKNTALSKEPNSNKLSRTSQNKNKSYVFNGSNSKSRSSQKAKKSDSFESLFSKKVGNLNIKKNNDLKQLQQKLHESFSYQDTDPKQHEKNITKSLNFTQFQTNLGTEQDQKVQSKKNIKIGEYFQKYSQILNKCSSINLKSQSETKKASQGAAYYHEFQYFKIEDINSLIDLIENCVQQANSYIKHLSTKLEIANDQLTELRKLNHKLEQYNKSNITIVREKQAMIQKLKQQLNKKHQDNKNQDIKNLLKTIDRLNEQNSIYRREIEKINSEKKVSKQSVANQIYRKIDILNISIDQNNHQNKISKTEPPLDQQAPSRSLSQTVKNYRFIKPRN